MKNKQKPPTIREQVRAAHAASGLSVNALARLAGLPESTVRRYLAGEIDTATAKADALLAAMAEQMHQHMATPTH